MRSQIICSANLSVIRMLQPHALLINKNRPYTFIVDKMLDILTCMCNDSLKKKRQPANPLESHQFICWASEKYTTSKNEIWFSRGTITIL